MMHTSRSIHTGQTTTRQFCSALCSSTLPEAFKSTVALRAVSRGVKTSVTRPKSRLAPGPRAEAGSVTTLSTPTSDGLLKSDGLQLEPKMYVYKYYYIYI